MMTKKVVNNFLDGLDREINKYCDKHKIDKQELKRSIISKLIEEELKQNKG